MCMRRPVRVRDDAESLGTVVHVQRGSFCGSGSDPVGTDAIRSPTDRGSIGCGTKSDGQQLWD